MGRSFWTALAAFLLPSFPLAYIWHLETFRVQYERLELFRDDILIPLGVAAMVVQGLIFAWAYPRLFSTRRGAWLSSAASFALVFGLLAWSFTTLPIAAKYQMTSVSSFMAFESAFTLLQFVVVAPRIALAWRDRT